MSLADAIAIVEIGGIEYESTSHRYQASVLKLADSFKVTIPAPNGKVLGATGYRASVMNVAQMGDPITLWISDPAVQNGRKVEKLRGRVIARNITSTASGTVMEISGADLGWHLSSCGPVFRSLRGLTWMTFAAKMLGLTLDGDGKVTADANGWGFEGVGNNNVTNRALRQGRTGANQAFNRLALKQRGILLPRIQVEIGQTLDALMIQYARLDGFLVNVSTDGWIQIFKPASSDGVTPYNAPVQYQFIHGGDQGNVLLGTLVFDEKADGLYTHVECYNTVIDDTNNDPANQNRGVYHGKFDPAIGERPFSFERRHVFSDAEQYSNYQDGTSRVNARARWQWQRFKFDSQTITFEVSGHSQGGVPFVEDTRATFKSDTLGLDGTYYVAAVEPYRKLAAKGFDSAAGTKCKITLKQDGLLGA